MKAMKKPRITRDLIATNLKVAIPCIMIGGTLGALVGSLLDSSANSIRVGIVLGGVIAFILLHNR